MSTSMKTFLSAAIPFGFIMGIFFGIGSGALTGVFSGVLCGLLFGVAISVFAKVQSKKFQKMGPEITGGKPILINGGANHFVGREGVGGWLYLTPDEMIFKSHSINLQKHMTILPLNEITGVVAVSTGFMPNGLHISMANGNNERFVVSNRNAWIEQIKNALPSLKTVN